MGVLKSGATGAATGGALGGIPGALIGAGAGIVGDLLGGLFGKSSQSSANKANIQMQRETNELNYKMFQEQQQNAWDMWNANNAYNTPENQRKLLESAGYNPSLLSPGVSSATPINAPGAPGAQVGNPLIPEDAFGKSVSSSVGMGAQTFAQLMSAEKDRQDSVSVGIDNLTKGARNEAQLRLLGDEHNANEIANFVAESTKEGRIKAIDLANNVMDSTIEKIDAEKLKVEAERSLVESNISLNEQQIKTLAAQAALWAEQKKTEITQQDLNKLLGEKAAAEANAARVNAWYQKEILPYVKHNLSTQSLANFHQAKQFAANARLLDEQKVNQHMNNTLLNIFGTLEKGIQIKNMIYSGNLTLTQIKDLQNQMKNRDRHMTVEEIRGFIDFIHEMRGISKDVAFLMLLGGM